ncbi:MAG: hypothetical protein ACJAT2_003475 [Bacteriovoracaceae bacterium]|jgi:hypothetical protein
MDASDVNVLLENEDNSNSNLDISEAEEIDDLESLKSDIGEVLFEEVKDKSIEASLEKEPEKNVEVINEAQAVEAASSVSSQGLEGKTKIFDVGNEEKELMEVAKYLEGKIPEDEWNEIATASKLERYVIQEGDWLWKICKKVFGSGFYYSKIWSLNPHIKNPHEIEPGMTLVFDTGDSTNLPEVQLGSFEETPGGLNKEDVKRETKEHFDFKKFGDDTKPDWIAERSKLIDEGIYFQYASEETYGDLAEIAKQSLKTEWEKYDPPVADIIISEPGEQYDDSGFDKDSKIVFDVKEGFYLNSFVTTNIVQDLGIIDASSEDQVYLQRFDPIYVKFDPSVKVKPGDLFSVYAPEGKVAHKVSDRTGYRYTVTGQIKTIRKTNHLWECQIFELSGLIRRGDRVTIYTPKITKIVKTFNKRNIEAAIIGAFNNTANGMSFGDVVYIDRGRADGVEMGTVFETFSFKDRNTEKRITPDPTYKTGELTVITLTDNFATALITNSSNEVSMGAIALSKTEEQAARESRLKNKNLLSQVNKTEGEALDELDIELNLDDIGEDLLRQADKVQLTEDELEELERQERERSILKDHERDLKELERLENELVEAEASLSEAKVDEDKFLEQQNLDEVERKSGEPDPNAFESLDEIEQDVGRKYMDEDINAKENPYGLTEFDLEEIDELLNTEKL